MRQVLSTAIVALVVAALTAVTVSAMAQSERESVTLAAVSDIDAHQVDGRHAVGAGASRARRAGKLVATDADGYLPSDILSPRPITDIDLTYVEQTFPIPDDATGSGAVECPLYTTVVGGGFSVLLPDVTVTGSRPLPASGWRVTARNTSGETRMVTAFAVCMAWTPH
jgi:hypothetical protein